MSRLRMRKKHRSVSIVNINMGKNEQFIMRKCAIYLDRLMDRYVLLDEETFDFLNWIAEPDMEKIGRYLLSLLPKSEREVFEEELLESEYDSMSYVRAVKRIIHRSGKKGLYRLEAFIQKVLRSRIKELDYRGTSSIEKNLSSFKKMFNLTEQEIEFALFFFIINVGCDPANDFFDSYLHCDSFIGRKYLTALLRISQKEFDKILAGTLSKIGFLEVDQYIRMNDDFLNIFQPVGWVE